MSWKRLKTTGPSPSPRGGHTATLVQHGDVHAVVVFGGVDRTGEHFNSTHLLDLGTGGTISRRECACAPVIAYVRCVVDSYDQQVANNISGVTLCHVLSVPRADRDTVQWPFSNMCLCLAAKWCNH
jgi:hypothetical protein